MILVSFCRILNGLSAEINLVLALQFFFKLGINIAKCEGGRPGYDKPCQVLVSGAPDKVSVICLFRSIFLFKLRKREPGNARLHVCTRDETEDEILEITSQIYISSLMRQLIEFVKDACEPIFFSNFPTTITWAFSTQVTEQLDGQEHH